MNPSHHANPSQRELIEAARLEAGELLAQPTQAATGPSAETVSALWNPDSFPGYHVTRELHRGGQGVVYQAIHKGTRRKVAIKVMREGPFASQAGRARFDREMQILGQMDDPHIVGIHDAGTAGGFHYFVMDYVSGQPLDSYAASQPWSLDGVVRLFERVCSAVNAAHVRGVIHRDLKPSNILVGNEGQPHILDFGLAKVVSGGFAESSEPTLMSITGQFIGSLPWASPEQAEGTPEKLDIRTDVYSLGVVFYQLLTGAFPYSVIGRMTDVLENIQNATPAKPSSIRPQVDDEVETIVLKCLAKERERRYQTSGELARDLRHYLAGEPIEAKRDSGWYMLKKLVGRYRAQVAVITLFGVLIVASAATVALVFARAAAAERSASRSRQFLIQTLLGADPEESESPEMTVVQAMERAAAIVDKELAAEPEAAAMLHFDIAYILRKRDAYDKAEYHARRALDLRTQLWGKDHRETAEAMHLLASVFWNRKDDASLDAAKPLYDEAFRIRRKKFGEVSQATAESLHHLAGWHFSKKQYDLAEEMSRKSLDIYRQLLGDHLDTARAYNNLAGYLRNQKKLDDAERAYREAIRIFDKLDGPGRFRAAKAKGSLGVVLLEARRFDEAEKLLFESLRTKWEFENDTVSVSKTLYDLARLFFLKEPADLPKARDFCVQSLELRKKLYKSDDHKEVLQSAGLLSEIDEAILGDAHLEKP